MPLHWSIEDIKDYKTVCFNGEGDDAEMKTVTSTLINLTMNLGINDWTDKNIDEVLLRLRMYESIYGKLVYNGTTGDNSLTNEVIRQHVGLYTNASSFSFAEFKKYCIEAIERRAKDLIEWHDRDNKGEAA